MDDRPWVEEVEFERMPGRYELRKDLSRYGSLEVGIRDDDGRYSVVGYRSEAVWWKPWTWGRGVWETVAVQVKRRGDSGVCEAGTVREGTDEPCGPSVVSIERGDDGRGALRFVMMDVPTYRQMWGLPGPHDTGSSELQPLEVDEDTLEADRQARFYVVAPGRFSTRRFEGELLDISPVAWRVTLGGEVKITDAI